MSQSGPVPQSVRECIQQAYRSYLKGREFRPRASQKAMIAAVARGLSDPETGGLAVVEAGTGTGKTAAYLLSALPIATHLELKLVIATATVALQEQILNKDLPELLEFSGLEFDYALAKGRGRYLCAAKLDLLLHEDATNPQQALYEDEAALRPSPERQRLFAELADAFASGRWDGDRDAWPEEIPPSSWRLLTSDHRQCTNRRCPHFKGCAFFEARQQLEEADVLVANQDLVLADLALGGGAVLPEPEKTLYIFDEGHHLADKALTHFSLDLPLTGTDIWLKGLRTQLHKLSEEKTADSGLKSTLEGALNALDDIRQWLPQLRDHLDTEQPGEPARDQGVHYQRFVQGRVPAWLARDAGESLRGFKRLRRHLDRLVETLAEALGEPEAALAETVAEAWYPVMGRALTRTEAGLALLEDYAQGADQSKTEKQGSPGARARWVARRRTEGGMETDLASSPILAAEHLGPGLWQRCAGALVTSATLTALGRFDHFRLSTGVPDEAHFCRLPSPFDYARQGRLLLPPMSADPRDAPAHDQAVVAVLEERLAPERGVLVLFTSWRQLRRVRESLSTTWMERILAQGDQSKEGILRAHRARLDAGEGSVIFGLASFAEGIDLPGAYLSQVFIAKIPFAVPGEPVEEALHEWVRDQGRDPFREVSIPLASLRLVQACGRLIRSESDWGEVLILDSRLRNRSYGRLLLDALPPFSRDGI